MAKYCLSLVLLYFAFSAHAQHVATDSVETFFKLDSTIRAEGENYPALCLTLSLRQERIERQFGVDSLVISATCNKGETLYLLGFLYLAIKEYYNALSSAERLHLPGYVARIANNMGLAYQALGDCAQSSDYFKKGKAILIEKGSYTHYRR